MSTSDCTINIPPPPPLTSSPSSMSLSTPCSTTMKVAGLTPFQSFLLRPADTRSVIVFIVACIGTFFVLLHVKKVVDSFSPASSESMSRSHMMSTLSITPSPTPTPPQIPILHTIIQLNLDIIGTQEDGAQLYPLTQYIPQLSSYQILSLRSLTLTSTSPSPSHYHTTISELLILQHGSIQVRLIDASNGHIEDVMLSVDDTHNDPMAILIYPNVCHTWNPIQPSQSSDVRMLSYSLRPIITSSTSSDPMKLLLSDRHTCPLSAIQYTQRDMIAVKSNI